MHNYLKSQPIFKVDLARLLDCTSQMRRIESPTGGARTVGELSLMPLSLYWAGANNET